MENYHFKTSVGYFGDSEQLGEFSHNNAHIQCLIIHLKQVGSDLMKSVYLFGFKAQAKK